MKPLSVILLAPDDSNKTGIATYADLLEQIFAKYLPSGIELSRVNEHDYLTRLRECGGEPVVLAQMGSNEGAIFRALFEQHRKFPGIRRIIEIHDPACFALSVTTFLENISRWLPGRVIRRGFQRAFGDYYIKAMLAPGDTLVCKTACGAGLLQKKLDRLGITVPVITIDHPNYLDAPLLKCAERQLSPRVGFFGYIHPDKGVHVLVAAALRLATAKGITAVPPIHIRGRVAAPAYAPYLDKLKRKVAAAGLDDKVLFGDFVPSDGLREFVSGLTALALPYQDKSRTSASGPLLWARSCGVPVIAHRTAAFTATVCHEVDGLLLPVNDIDQWAAVLAEIAALPSWGDRFQQGIGNSQTETSWPVIAKKYLDVIQS
jgi:glycosyltransferase involved in cell wall biosynthesis